MSACGVLIMKSVLFPQGLEQNLGPSRMRALPFSHANIVATVVVIIPSFSLFLLLSTFSYLPGELKNMCQKFTNG